MSQEHSPATYDTFEQWWKANAYKFPQADYAADSYEEIAHAAWEARATTLQNAAPQASSTQDSTRTGDDIGPSARHPTEKETGGAPAVAAPETTVSERGLRPAEGHCLLQVPQQTPENPSPCAMAGHCIGVLPTAVSAIGQRQRALEELLSRVEDGERLIQEGECSIERAWHMATAQATRINAAPDCDIEPIEVCSALRWTMENFEAALAGKVIVNADEVISNAKRVLEKWETK